MDQAVIIGELAGIIWAVVEVIKYFMGGRANGRVIATCVAIVVGVPFAMGLVPLNVVDTVAKIIVAVLGASAAQNYLWKPVRRQQGT